MTDQNDFNDIQTSDASQEGMRPETAEFLDNLSGIGTGAFLDMRQADTPELRDWRNTNFAPDGSGNYVSRDGQPYTNGDLRQIHGVLSEQAGNPLISQLFNGPKSQLADYMTWRNHNYYNDTGGGWEDEDGDLYSEPALQEMFGAKFANGNSGDVTETDGDMSDQLATAKGTGNSGSAGFDLAQIPFFKPKEVPPPPAPPAPGVPPFAFDQARINKLTVEKVAGIVFNENRDVLPGDSTSEDLQAAKTAQAHAVINGDHKLGDGRPATATWKVSDRLKKTPQYEQALAAARAAFQEDNLGTDPTKGRIYFNNRFDGNQTGPRFYHGSPQDPYHTFGPFIRGQDKVWTVIYDDYRKKQ